MTRKKPNYVENSQWDCIENEQAREITIIDVYKSIFERDCIPQKKQYWTMCGAYFNFKQNRIVEGELIQLLETKLITKNQFYGVDREEKIIAKNKELFPDTNWIQGDFYTTMKEFIINRTFNPAIINYDGVMQPKYGTQYLKKIMKLLDYGYESEVLLIANFVLINPYRKSEKLTFTIQDTVKKLAKIYLIPDHWGAIPFGYVYTGVSRGAKAQMGMLVFLKRKHDINNINISPNRMLGDLDLEGLKDFLIKNE